MQLIAKEMKTTSPSNSPISGQPKRAKVLPRWLAYPLALIVWGVVPWAISLLGPRYGWVAGRPDIWNLLGLIPVVVGIAGFLWTFDLHFAQAPRGVEWELTQSFLLTRGPYAFSRHPMYLSELVLLLGWILLYGSIAVLIAFLVWWTWFSFVQAPLEERALEARYGEVYREYKQRVPRWFGKR
jgi:protein-S-isoprenylcysteine O-methyltransferase Ste14